MYANDFFSTPLFWILGIIVFIMIGLFFLKGCFNLGQRLGSRTGSQGMNEWADFVEGVVSLIGFILKWLFKGLAFIVLLIVSLFRREAPSFSDKSSNEKDSYDDSEDDEDEKGQRKPPKIDEYHV